MTDEHHIHAPSTVVTILFRRPGMVFGIAADAHATAPTNAGLALRSSIPEVVRVSI
jgi:hypothetical protein